MKPKLFLHEGKWYVQSGIVALGFPTQGECWCMARLYWDSVLAGIPTCNEQDRPSLH